VNRLLNRMRAHFASGRVVLFLDVGADVGTYSVTVGNMLRGAGDLAVLAFEPSASSHRLLQQNVTANHLDGVVSIRKLALGDGSITAATLRFDPTEPGGTALESADGDGEQVRVSTIDAELADAPTPDVLVLKLDVEGSETAVLHGAATTLAAANEVLLLVEDFVDDRIVAELERSGWSFAEKLTPYNSFWRRGSALVLEPG
jgi:FkbM family methyltransferase